MTTTGTNMTGSILGTLTGMYSWRIFLESDEIKVASNGGKYLPSGDETKQTPLYLSCCFAYRGDMNNIYPSGGAGYTFNKAALKMLIVNGYPNYFPDDVGFAEDWMLGRIFQKMAVFAYDTQNENGEERFNPFTVSHAFLLLS
jgi:glycoprotein-N-acetylgalactosamine 3-beta-galactosyltransferase